MNKIRGLHSTNTHNGLGNCLCSNGYKVIFCAGSNWQKNSSLVLKHAHNYLEPKLYLLYIHIIILRYTSVYIPAGS